MSGLEQVRCAVTAADTGTRWWTLAVRTQAETPGDRVDHGDLYGLAGAMLATLHTLDDLAGTFARQTDGYRQGRVLRDDAGTDPHERLELAADAANDLARDLRAALRDAHVYGSAIAHVAIADIPPHISTTDGPSEGGRS